MSDDSFSADWLALREPADHAARNLGLAAELGAWMEQTGAMRVLDIGCGSGSTVRALNAHLPDGAEWTLLDHDEKLLKAASARLLDWADEREETDGTLRLSKGGKRLAVRFAQCALSADSLASLFDELGAQAVTASAFFDLAGEAFIEAFAAAARASGVTVYAALNYDGLERWAPEHPAEPEALAALHAHMQREKGLGPASGPRSVSALGAALNRNGFQVTRAPSPWRLSAPADAPLIRELAGGSVAAVAELEPNASWLQDWNRARLAATRVEIGHADILALPPD